MRRSRRCLGWACRSPIWRRREAILLIGSDIRQEQPLLAHRIRKAALAGATVACVNPLTLALTHPARQLVGTRRRWSRISRRSPRRSGRRRPGHSKAIVRSAKPDDAHQAIADAFVPPARRRPAVVLLGALGRRTSRLCPAQGAGLSDRRASGAVGGLSAGVGEQRRCPSGRGRAARSARRSVRPSEGPRTRRDARTPRARWSSGVLEPDRDVIDPARAMAMCEQADLVVACSAFRAPSLDAVADVLLPIGAFAETSGDLRQRGRTWQRFQGAVAPPGEARPGWKVLRVLGNLLDLPGFEYRDAAQVRDELGRAVRRCRVRQQPRAATIRRASTGTHRRADALGSVPIYAWIRWCDARRPCSGPRSKGRPSVSICIRSRRVDGLSADQTGLGHSERREVEANVCSWTTRAGGLCAHPGGGDGSERLGAQIGPVEIRPWFGGRAEAG
jgi:NADH-quinone oxidoreductase subunit G